MYPSTYFHVSYKPLKRDNNQHNMDVDFLQFISPYDEGIFRQ